MDAVFAIWFSAEKGAAIWFSAEKGWTILVLWTERLGVSGGSGQHTCRRNWISAQKG
jgi:hypothetical protein